MAFLSAAYPYIAAGIGAAGALQQGAAAKQASDQNAQSMLNERKIAVDQSNVQEGLVRRASREALGKEAAAFGAANVGFGGSSETALASSAVNQEIDALNTRYRGTIIGYGYGVQAGIDRRAGQVQETQGGLMAGAALLKSLGPYYSTGPSASAQAGLTAPS